MKKKLTEEQKKMVEQLCKFLVEEEAIMPKMEDAINRS